MDTNGSTKRGDRSRIPVAYLILGYENNRQAIIEFFRNAKKTTNWVTDAIEPAVSEGIEWLNKEIFDAGKRGVKIKQITDITNEKLQICKRRMTRIDELRHLGGIGVVFGFSDVEFIAMVSSFAPREDIKRIQFIQSDSESVVGYKQSCFDLLWDRATPARSRINELEGKIAGTTTAGHAKAIIDRIYVCEACRLTFVYSNEVEEHEKTTDHKNFREYPIVLLRAYPSNVDSLAAIV